MILSSCTSDEIHLAVSPCVSLFERAIFIYPHQNAHRHSHPSIICIGVDSHCMQSILWRTNNGQAATMASPKYDEDRSAVSSLRAKNEGHA